jgi:DNA-binding transcriptional ArsR family regulator
MDDLKEHLRIYKAVSNETRLAILLAFIDRNPSMSFTQLKQIFSLTPAVLKYHLEVLQKAGLIKNVYRKVTNVKDYSYYELTDEGKRTLKSIGITKSMVLQYK